VLIYQNIVSLFVMADAIRNNFLRQIAFFARRAARIPAVFDFLSIFFNLWSFFKVNYN